MVATESEKDTTYSTKLNDLDINNNNNMDSDNTIFIKKDNGFSEEHQIFMKKKKQIKKEKKLNKKQHYHEKKSKTTFFGKHKWLGGAIDPKTGKVYGIPSHSYQVICITPSTPTSKAEISTIPLPNEYQKGHFKWLRGLVYDNNLYGIPAWNVKGVLKVNLHPSSSQHGDKNRIKILPLPHDPCYYLTKPVPLEDADVDKETIETNKKNPRFSNIDRGRWMWHGGAVGKFSEDDNSGAAIYCIPSNATHVLKIHLDDSDIVEEIGPSLSEGQNKWYGGILGKDGCIYGMPYTATGVLRINPRNDSVQVLGNYPAGGYKWHGGLLAKNTGFIYAFPAHSNEVLYVDTNPKIQEQEQEEANDDESWRVGTIPINRHENDTDPIDLNYKWLGGSYGADGCIYGMPSDATTILRIDPIKHRATTFGKVSNTINKWQGGVLSMVDKCIYAVPADMDCVLRIHTDPDKPVEIEYVGKNFQDIDDKWQGGFHAIDDKIYAIPENINNVMVITPGEKPIVEMLM